MELWLSNAKLTPMGDPAMICFWLSAPLRLMRSGCRGLKPA